jgi:hypothetical protein
VSRREDAREWIDRTVDLARARACEAATARRVRVLECRWSIMIPLAPYCLLNHMQRERTRGGWQMQRFATAGALVARQGLPYSCSRDAHAFSHRLIGARAASGMWDVYSGRAGALIMRKRVTLRGAWPCTYLCKCTIFFKRIKGPNDFVFLQCELWSSHLVRHSGMVLTLQYQFDKA